MARVVAAVCLCAGLAGPLVAGAASCADAVRGLIERILPGRGNEFVFEQIPADAERDVFEVESARGAIVIRGSNGVAAAVGLNWYLENIAHCQFSLWGENLALPSPAPAVPAKVRQVCAQRMRYCFNYCAFSYSLAWWDWPQWERAIDWMALRGITMPLAVTGQEAVWDDVLRGLGLDDREIDAFFVGPGYLPFGWMGCIDGWCGPLATSWIARHAELGKKIIDRERELGMTPVLQGFTGHVPESLQRVVPGAKLLRLRSWCRFPGTWFVDPGDPLFERIGKLFIDAQTRRFGTDNLYASDTFIEMSPPSNEPAFLDAMGKAIHRAMTAGDPKAVWVLQGWLFVNNPKFWQEPQRKAFLGSVPQDRMVVLDLFCETRPTWNITEAFDGKPWIFCVLHSFGDQVCLYAGLPQIARNLREARSSPKRGSLEGLGLIMEGLGYNPAVYDFLLQTSWRNEVPEPTAWLDEWLTARYGRLPPKAREAWSFVLRSAYAQPRQTRGILCARPSLELSGGDPDEEVGAAWGALLGAADELGGIDTYRYDLVHVARQGLTSLGNLRVREVLDAFRARNRAKVADAGRRLCDLVRDLDMLLATRREFLLGKWLEDAKRWGANEDERRLCELNARTIITLWGPRDSGLHEYAQKEWSGMFRGFYLPRWELFLKRLDASLAAGTPLDATKLENDLKDLEVAWTRATETYAAAPRGDPVAIARTLWDKYGSSFKVERDAPSLTTGKPVTCSAFLMNHEPRWANDGRTTSTDRYWATDVTNDPAAWWQVDLEQPTTVGRVVVVLYYGDRRTYGLTVEGSLDGASWTLLADRRDNKEPSTRTGLTCVFPQQSVRYLRVTVTSNSANTGRHLVEVMAFER